MIEIELKAHIDASVAARLHSQLLALCGAGEPVDKRDTYFALSDGHPTATRHIRIRQSGGSTRGTVKIRSVQNGVEYNREQEFDIASYDDFAAALLLYGFQVAICKHKQGCAYRYEQLLIEVVTVESLGHFVEIEQLLPECDASPARRRASSRLLKRMLERLAVPAAAIEPRRYIDLLRADS